MPGLAIQGFRNCIRCRDERATSAAREEDAMDRGQPRVSCWRPARVSVAAHHTGRGKKLAVPWPKGGEPRRRSATPEARAHPLMQGVSGTQVYGPALSALERTSWGAGTALMYGDERGTYQSGDRRSARGWDALMIGAGER